MSLVSTVGSTEASAAASSVSTGGGTGSTGDSIVVSTAAAGTDEVTMWADEDRTAAVSTLVSTVSAEVLGSIPSDGDADVELVAEEREEGGTGACFKLEAAGKTDAARSVFEVVAGLEGRAVRGRGEEEEEDVQDKGRGMSKSTDNYLMHVF